MIIQLPLNEIKAKSMPYAEKHELNVFLQVGILLRKFGFDAFLKTGFIIFHSS